MRNHLRPILIALLLMAMLAGTAAITDAVSLPLPQSAAAEIDVAPHRALYDFRTVSVESGAGLTGVQGKMYYEQDDACDAWTMEHRFSVEYQYPERSVVLNTSHYVAWEAKDQSRFYFSSERQEDGEMIEQLRGSVIRGEDGTAVAEYARPGDLSFALPRGYLLPAMHTGEIIRRARAGERFFSAVMFDGTDAEGPVDINAFIGKKATPAEIEKLVSRYKDKIDVSLLAPEAWHVRMAFFPLAEDEDMSPAYEMEIVLHANGVVSYALVDYKSFKIEQNLLALEKLPAKKCT